MLATYMDVTKSDEADCHDADNALLLSDEEEEDARTRGGEDNDNGDGSKEITPYSLSRRGRKSLTAKEAKFSYHFHPTCLVQIPDIDIVKDCLLDVMHFVFGHLRTVLYYHNGKGPYGAMYKLSSHVLRKMDERLIETRKYCPRKFQRKAESLEYLASWKATQLRQFLLYIGVVIFHGLLDDAKLHHFHLLVVAMRYMARKLPTANVTRQETVKLIAQQCQKLLCTYFTI
jgi:hypothetical protein